MWSELYVSIGMQSSISVNLSWQLSKMSRQKSEILFSFGAISDVQWGDLENRLNYSQTATRYYRRALTYLREAIQFWNCRRQRPAFVLQLGDLIDGFNARIGNKEHSWDILQKALNECEAFVGEVHHVWGNHEFYNFSRLDLLNTTMFSGRNYRPTHSGSQVDTACLIPDVIDSTQTVTSQAPDASCTTSHYKLCSPPVIDENIPIYYDFSPCPGFRFVSLDTYDISTLGYSRNNAVTKAAFKLLESHNKNDDLNSPDGLEGREKRFVEFNGAVSIEQLNWLKDILKKAESCSEKVILFSHIPFYTDQTDSICLLWNYEEVLRIIHSSKCVVASLSGHYHDYRCLTDGAGVHHIVLDAVVEAPPGTNSYVTFDVYPDRLIMEGQGEMPSLELVFRH